MHKSKKIILVLSLVLLADISMATMPLSFGFINNFKDSTLNQLSFDVLSKLCVSMSSVLSVDLPYSQNIMNVYGSISVNQGDQCRFTYYLFNTQQPLYQSEITFNVKSDPTGSYLICDKAIVKNDPESKISVKESNGNLQYNIPNCWYTIKSQVNTKNE